MPPNRPRRPSGIPGLDWVTTDDGSLTLWDCDRNETFHSGCGAVAQSLVVYLVNSGVLDRLAQQLPTRVFEFGLGTGTNLLLTAAIAARFQTPMEYWAIDNRVVPAEVLRQLWLGTHLPKAIQDNSNLNLALRSLSEDDFAIIDPLESRLADWLDELSRRPGSPHELDFKSCCLLDGIQVHLLIGNATSLSTHLPQANPLGQQVQQFDAVYFDPFSPASSPELWQDEVLRTMHSLLRPGGTLTSYCVKGSVRRKLARLGFNVQRLAGPVGGKREVLRAEAARPIPSS